jgi:NAD(P)-dependent dehydrogenase (short-subunit alcohol dehydrogenase family)
MKQTWLVTGASRGLGAMIAQAVLARGNNLVATARDKNSVNYGDTSKLNMRVIYESAAPRDQVLKMGMTHKHGA